MNTIKNKTTGEVMCGGLSLETVLFQHKQWLNLEEGGSAADLRGADLRGADLSGANLVAAYMYGADLSGANLSGTNLYGSDLSGARVRAHLSAAQA